MSYRHLLHPLAHQDFIEAYEWYEEKQTGLGDRFAVAITKMIGSITDNPEIYGTKERKTFREATIKDFPFIIVYKLLLIKELVVISSIHHTKKHPGKKYRK